jgi:hypothetical protein
VKAKILTGARAATVLAVGVSEVKAVPVDLELILLADVSASLNANDFQLQRDGYVAAFQDAVVINEIVNGDIGAIAATLVYWSTSAATAVPWTLINDQASSQSFASAIGAAPRSSSQSTGMTAALDFATNLVGQDNGYEGTRFVIDISGDGAETDDCDRRDLVCQAVQDARDAALAAGVQSINALWIEDEVQPSVRNYFCLDASCDINPLQYGATNVLAGPKAFQSVVSDFDGFEVAIKGKIFTEIGDLPEPATLGLLGFGIIGLGFAARRRKVG